MIEVSFSYLTPPVKKNCKSANWVTNFCYCGIDHFFVIDLDNPLYSTQLSVSRNSRSISMFFDMFRKILDVKRHVQLSQSSLNVFLIAPPLTSSYTCRWHPYPSNYALSMLQSHSSERCINYWIINYQLIQRLLSCRVAISVLIPTIMLIFYHFIKGWASPGNRLKCLGSHIFLIIDMRLPIVACVWSWIRYHFLFNRVDQW